MSKKNNKQKSKQYHNFLIEQDKEKARRANLKQQRKIVKSMENQISNTLSQFNLNDTHKTNNQIEDMQVDKYRRPKKAQRIRKREREFIRQKQLSRHS